MLIAVLYQDMSENLYQAMKFLGTVAVRKCQKAQNVLNQVVKYALLGFKTSMTNFCCMQFFQFFFSPPNFMLLLMVQTNEAKAE